MSTCKSCGRQIRWAKTEAGKAIPLDVDPVADGNVVLGDDGVAYVLGRYPAPGTGVVGEVKAHPETPRYQAHFRSCPHARQHRRAT